MIDMWPMPCNSYWVMIITSDFTHSPPMPCNSYWVMIITSDFTHSPPMPCNSYWVMIITSDFTHSPPVLSGIRIAQSLVFCVLFCMLLFFLLSFSFRPLYCLSFFNLRFMITPLVSFHKTCNQTLHWSITLLKTTI